jgi:hypothetical protein
MFFFVNFNGNQIWTENRKKNLLLILESREVNIAFEGLLWNDLN